MNFDGLALVLLLLVHTEGIMVSRKREAPVPSYYKLQMHLVKAIEEKEWVPGQSIPTEKNLAEAHGVSIGTVKKALLNLANDGYLYREQGRGTFVAGTTVRRESLRYYRFLADFDDIEADLQIKLVSIKKTIGISEINHFLKADPDAELYKIQRKFIYDKKPLILTTSYLLEHMFPGLENYPESVFEKMPLYQTIEDKYGVTTVYNKKLISAVCANHSVARELEIAKGAPLVFIEMQSFTYKDIPYEYRTSYCITENKKVFVEI